MRKRCWIFLDEMWFYITGRQIRIHCLPLSSHEPEVIYRVKHPRALGSRFPFKVMFMGVFTQPIPELGFDRRIFLKSISEKKALKKTSYNQIFQMIPLLMLRWWKKMADEGK